MRKLTFVLLLSLLASPIKLWAQFEAETSWLKVEDLLLSIAKKNDIERRQTYIRKNNIKECVVYKTISNDGEQVGKKHIAYIIRYNEDGTIRKFLSHHSGGSIAKEVNFSYQNGKLSGEEVVGHWSSFFKRDYSGNLTEFRAYDDNGTIQKYKFYYLNNKLFKMREFGKSNSSIKHKRFKIDKKSGLPSSITTGKEGVHMDSLSNAEKQVLVFEYDIHGNLSKTLKFDAFDKEYESDALIIVYNRNDQQLLTEVKQLDFSGEVTTVSSFTYNEQKLVKQLVEEMTMTDQKIQYDFEYVTDDEEEEEFIDPED